MSELMFDIDEEKEVSFGPIPEGAYMLQIVKAEMKDTKSGGKMISCELQVTEGEFEGRKLWHNFNYVNDSEKAQAIGRGTLKTCCLAMGLSGMVEDTEDLCFHPFLGKVGIKSSPGYSDQNNLYGFDKAESLGKTIVRKKAEAERAEQGLVDEDKLPF